MKDGIHFLLTLQNGLENRTRKFMLMMAGGKLDREETGWTMRRLLF